MDIKRFAITAAAAAGLSVSTAGVTFAQETTPVAPQAQQQGPAEYSEETLRSFAVAFLQTEKISQEYRPQLQKAQQAQDQARMQELQSEASQKMVDAVEETDGISVQEYTSIMQAAQTDPDLAQKVSDYIGEASGGAQPAQ